MHFSLNFETFYSCKKSIVKQNPVLVRNGINKNVNTLLVLSYHCSVISQADFPTFSLKDLLEVVMGT